MPEPAEKLLLIGEFAKLAGTNLRTLRYYEEIGLFAPAERSQGGFRYYRKTDVNRLRLIQGFQDLGLSLEDIGRLLATRSEEISRREFLSRIECALQAQDDLLEERIRAIQTQQERIREARKKLGECAPCEQKPSTQNNFCEPCPINGETLPEQLSALF